MIRRIITTLIVITPRMLVILVTSKRIIVMVSVTVIIISLKVILANKHNDNNTHNTDKDNNSNHNDHDTTRTPRTFPLAPRKRELDGSLGAFHTTSTTNCIYTTPVLPVRLLRVLYDEIKTRIPQSIYTILRAPDTMHRPPRTPPPLLHCAGRLTWQQRGEMLPIERLPGPEGVTDAFAQTDPLKHMVWGCCSRTCSWKPPKNVSLCPRFGPANVHLLSSFELLRPSKTIPSNFKPQHGPRGARCWKHRRSCLVRG